MTSQQFTEAPEVGSCGHAGISARHYFRLFFLRASAANY
jgi:hypothetical protein